MNAVVAHDPPVLSRLVNSERAFYAVATLLFVTSTAATIAACASMSTMSGMQMPGGWTMSMMWMRMPGQTWPGAAASFLGMWVVMMVAMMLPSLLPMLRRYRNAVRANAHAPLVRATLLVGLGYFLVWSILGLIAFPFGAALAAIAMKAPPLSQVVPLLIGVVIAIVGALQFTRWKARQLACCRGERPCHRASTDDALRHGLELGVRCALCCGGMTIVLMVVGVMDLYVMALVTTAITLERLAPNGDRTARAIGVVTVTVGLILVACAG